MIVLLLSEIITDIDFTFGTFNIFIDLNLGIYFHKLLVMYVKCM